MKLVKTLDSMLLVNYNIQTSLFSLSCTECKSFHPPVFKASPQIFSCIKVWSFPGHESKLVQLSYCFCLETRCSIMLGNSQIVTKVLGRSWPLRF